MSHPVVDAVLIGDIQPLGPGRSAIRKTVQSGPVAIGMDGPVGDQHASRNHGGAEKAVLQYAREHYEQWIREFPGAEQHLRHHASFGENLSTTGMTEETVCIGDVYRLGETVLQVCQPRQPCWKLGYLAAAPRIPYRMQETGWTGWYYRVVQPGAVRAGDRFELLERPESEWTLSRVITGFYADPLDQAFLTALRGLDLLGGEWRTAAGKRLESGVVENWTRRLDVPRR